MERELCSAIVTGVDVHGDNVLSSVVLTTTLRTDLTLFNAVKMLVDNARLVDGTVFISNVYPGIDAQNPFTLSYKVTDGEITFWGSASIVRINVNPPSSNSMEGD